MGWLKRITDRGDRLDQSAYRMDCVPLVILDPDEGVVYAKNTQIEFHPDPERPTHGLVVALTPADSGWTPSLRIVHRFDTPLSIHPGVRTRGGTTLIGEDDEGFSFTWYTNSVADRILLHTPKAQPQIRTLTEEKLTRILATNVDSIPPEAVIADPLVVIMGDGDCPFLGRAEIVLRHVGTSELVSHVTVIGTDFELFVLNEQAHSKEGEGHILFGVDRLGRSATWYLDAAADTFTETL